MERQIKTRDGVYAWHLMLSPFNQSLKYKNFQIPPKEAGKLQETDTGMLLSIAFSAFPSPLTSKHTDPECHFALRQAHPYLDLARRMTHTKVKVLIISSTQKHMHHVRLRHVGTIMDAFLTWSNAGGKFWPSQGAIMQQQYIYIYSYIYIAIRFTRNWRALLKGSSKSRDENKNFVTSNRCSATLLSCAAPWRRPLRRTGIGSCLQLCWKGTVTKGDSSGTIQEIATYQAKNSATNCHLIPFKPWQRQLSPWIRRSCRGKLCCRMRTPQAGRGSKVTKMGYAWHKTASRDLLQLHSCTDSKWKLWQGNCFKHWKSRNM